MYRSSKTHLLIGAVLAFCLTGPLYAQELRFELFTDFDELGCGVEVNGALFDFIQDSRGYLWCFNRTTLIRYNGIESKEYRYDPFEPSSIDLGDIHTIYRDKGGVIWIGYVHPQGAIDKFDQATEQIERLEKLTTRLPPAARPHSVTDFYEDRRGDMWVGTSGAGLTRIEIQSAAKFHFMHDPDNGASLSGNNIIGKGAILEDRHGELWVLATSTILGWASTPDTPSEPVPRSGTLHRFDAETGTFKRYAGNQSVLETDGVTAMMEDEQGGLWIGTKDGDLYTYDRETDVFVRRVDLSCGGQVGRRAGAPHACTALFSDASGNIWIGSSGSGLTWYDPESNRTEHFERDSTDPEGLPANSISGIWQTDEGLLWMEIGSRLYRVDVHKPWLRNYTHDPEDPASADPIRTSAFHEDRLGNRWIGGLTNGFGRLDRSTGRIEQIPNSRGQWMSVYDIHETVTGELLVAGSGRPGEYPTTPTISTIWRLDRIRKILEPVYDSDGTFHFLSIADDPAGFLWLGWAPSKPLRQLGVGGLIRWNPRNKIERRYDYVTGGPDKSISGSVMCLLRDREGTLWVGAAGLLRYRPETDDFETVVSTDATINSLLEDARGRFWYASSPGGLSLLDRTTGQTTTFGVELGLPDNRIGGLLEDQLGFIWMSTNVGISRFDPDHCVFRNLTTRDGLLDAYYGFDITQSYLRDSDGALYYGGHASHRQVGGFSVIHPDRFVGNTAPPNVVFESFALRDETLLPSETGPLAQPVWNTTELELRHNQDDFSLSYVGLHFTEPSRITYAYMLEGLDDDWIQAGQRRTVRYTRIPPGTYTFRVKAANPGGIWSEPAASSLALIVQPPLWKTWWAFGGYVFFLSALLFGGFRWRTHRLRRHAAELHTRVQERTRQLADEKQKVEEQAKRLVELEQTKDRFFANISHEFRTPLMLIQGPIQDVIDGEYGTIDEQARRQLVMAKRSSKQLHQLIDQLLDLSKLDVGQLYLQVEKHDLNAFVQSVVDAFSSLAERNGISLGFAFDQPELNVNFDRGKLEKVVGNLITNAVKFTDRGGRVEVSTSSRADTAFTHAIISVRDTGIGIPVAELPRIFDRFFQVGPDSSRDVGTGIGLALVRELVELHGGKVKVESILGAGSTFEVLLPMEAEHLLSVSEAPASDSYRSLDLIDETAETNGEPEVGEALRLDATVLVVEDNDDLRRYIVHHLERMCHVEEASDGKEGLQKALVNPPDLVLADIMMPRMDGLALCEQIKRDPRLGHIPVVLLTAIASEDAKLEGLQAGADDYLYKPFNPQELQTRIENLIEIRRQLRVRFSGQDFDQPSDNVIESENAIFMRRVSECVVRNLSNTHFTLDQLADEVAVSLRQLHRKMRELGRLSPAGYVRLIRMEKAARLIEARAGTVAEVALKVGYRDATTFSRLFRQVFGVHPSEYSGGNQQVAE